MPFKSKKQVAKFAEFVAQGKMSRAQFERWLGETPSVDELPTRVSKKRTRPKRSKVRYARVIK